MQNQHRLKTSSVRVSLLSLGLTALLAFGGCDSGGDGGGGGGGADQGKAGGTAAGGSTAGAQPGAGDAKKEEAPATAGGDVFKVDQATAATISGKANFSGNPPPKSPPIQFSADPNCAALHSSPVFPEDFVLNGDGKTLKNVLVYVSKGLEGKTFAVPTEPVVFDQNGCQYKPHVFGIMAKQKLEILNSDATNHNVHSLPKNSREFNIGMPNKGMKTTQTFAKKEVTPPVVIKCEVHNWMKAHCAVLDHPYFAVTDDKGAFKIANLPPGKYTLTAWHEKLGEQKQDIEVAPKDEKSVDFEFKG